MGVPNISKIKCIIFFFLSFFICFPQGFANEETFFVATAYYSPLPGQDSYITGSYAGDIRLNGEGKHTASGKPVFPGLLAGPKNYPFGTKIYFEGYGIGEIADRGGAIVKAGERGHSYDRIDIWMGYGDAGLDRAKRWGKRTIKGKIVIPSSEVSLSFPQSQVGPIGNYSVNPESHDAEEVKKVQVIFQKADLYTGEIDGAYESIKDEIIAYQITAGIIEDASDEAAGWFGPKTVSALRREFAPQSDIILNTEEDIKFSSYNHKQASEKYKVILEYGDLQVSPDSDAEDVLLLQELLQELGEYSGELDGKYASIEGPLIMLQKKIGLVSDSEDWGAGYFGNKTKSALWAYYEDENDTVLEKELAEKNEVYHLSESEKQALENAFEKYKAFLLQQQKAGKGSQQIRIAQLKQNIENILPRIKDPLKKAKILYIQEIL